MRNATTLPRRLNYEAMARSETSAYIAYYQRDRTSFLGHFSELLQWQFELTQEHARSVAELFTESAMAFGEFPLESQWEVYEQSVLPKLTSMYEALARSLDLNWNTNGLAKSELEWWVARRHPSTREPEMVAPKMAALWSGMYGPGDEGHFFRAAYLRAVAGRFGDVCREKWHRCQSVDWKTTERLLAQAYVYLSLGIQKSLSTEN